MLVARHSDLGDLGFAPLAVAAASAAPAALAAGEKLVGGAFDAIFGGGGKRKRKKAVTPPPPPPPPPRRRRRPVPWFKRPKIMIPLGAVAVVAGALALRGGKR